MKNKAVLIVGGGIAGVQSALKLANEGNQVYLIEHSPGLSGERILPDHDFGGAHFVASKVEEVIRHENIQVILSADLQDVEEQDGKFKVRVNRRPSRIIEDKCDGCKACIKVCPINLWDDYNGRLSFRTAIDFSGPQPGFYNIVREDMPICQETCPVHLDIRGYIGLIADGKFKESLALIREKLPFPATIGRICPHPCEEECNRGIQDEPLAIRGLKRFVADYEMLEARKPSVSVRGPILQEKIAVIGSGPAGLTCAHDLSILGYQITVFESLPVAGGMLYVGIPEYRLPKHILKQEIGLIKDLGVEIKTDTPIGPDLTIDDLFRQGFMAVFIAVGAHRSRRLGVPGEEAQGVVHGVDLLRDLNLGQRPMVGEKVAVIGGGNVAMDAARSALRLGAKKVFILYRRSRQEMPASREEIEALEAERIEIQYLAAPTEILTNNGKVIGMKCVRMELGEPDASGRRRPIPIEGSKFDIELDMVIPAIGQAPDLSFLGDFSGIETKKGNTIVVDPDTLATTRIGVFAGGDAITGPAIAIEAIAAGQRAAISIDEYLRGK